MKKKLFTTVTLILLLVIIGCAKKTEEKPKEAVIEKVKPFTAFIYQDTKAYNEPNESKPLIGLSVGRVVTVFEKKGDWSKIVFYTYDHEGNNIGWINNNTYTDEGKFMELIEGQTKSEVYLFSNVPPQGKKTEFKVDKGTPIFITGKTQNGWVQGIFPKGKSGFLEDKNIAYIGPSVK